MPDPIFSLGWLNSKEVLIKTKIGEMAEGIWETLGEREAVAVSRLPKS